MTARGEKPFAGIEKDAHGGAARRDDLLHPGAGADLCATRLRGCGHSLRDGAHAADGMPPGAALAIHLAEAVVQEDVGGAGRRRGGVVADDAVEGEGRLDGVALEPAVEEVGGAAGEEIDEDALVGETQIEEALADAGALSLRGCRRLHSAGWSTQGRAARRRRAPAWRRIRAGVLHRSEKTGRSPPGARQGRRASGDSGDRQRARSSPPAGARCAGRALRARGRR